jgi:hypothetical protein
MRSGAAARRCRRDATSAVARVAFKLRAEIVERCFALVLDRGGMRRTWLRGRENIHKRYLIHVAGDHTAAIVLSLQPDPLG